MSSSNPEPSRFKRVFRNIFNQNSSPQNSLVPQHEVATPPLSRRAPQMATPPADDSSFAAPTTQVEDTSSEQNILQSRDNLGDSALSPSERTDDPPLYESGDQPTSHFSPAPPNSLAPGVLAGAAGDSTTAPPVYEIDDARGSAAANAKSAGPMKDVWNGVVTVLRIVEKSADSFPPLKSAVGGLVACIELTQRVKGNNEDYTKLMNDLKTLTSEIAPYLHGLLRGDTSGSFGRIVKSLEDEVEQIRVSQGRSTVTRIVEAQYDVGDIADRYRRIVNLFQRIQCNVGLRTWEATMEVFQLVLLERLSPVNEARYNSSYSTTVKRRGCTAQTREIILQTLLKWARNPDGAKIYWMDGIAGTGKTTILFTLCQLLADEQRLGANFFCSRISLRCRDINTIIPTLAYQLAQYSPAFRSALCKTLKEEPEASKLNVTLQLEKLIEEPLRRIANALPEDVIVAIDALDECEDSSAVSLFLRALLNVVDSLPIKIIITSRPEPTIRERIRLSPYSNSIFHLHDVEGMIVKADIELYLIEAFAEIFPPVSQLPLQLLADRAGKLFIFAATAVRYISPGDPAIDSMDRLRRVLASTSSTKQHEEIDALYRSILSMACDANKLEPDELEYVHLTLKTVVCAKEPMTVQVLASILRLTRDQVSVALRRLGSVLHIQDGADGLVAPFHASFPEFIFDRQRSHEFACDMRAHNAILSEGCFSVMKAQLRFNICNLESSFFYDECVPNLHIKVKTSISDSLFYASRFWGFHLAESESLEVLGANINHFLSNQLLFWMEVLNLTCRIFIAQRSLEVLRIWLGGIKDYDADIKNQLYDAEEFVTRFAEGACRSSTPHIYISLLPFCRRDSSVYRNYWPRMKGLIGVQGRLLETRLSSERRLSQVPGLISSIAVSPDGNLIACGMIYGVAHIVDAHTGAPIVKPAMINIEPDPVIQIGSVTFSHDGNLIAVLSGIQVRIWNLAGGFGIIIFEVHEIDVVSFSPDNSTIATSSDGKIRLWNAHDGQTVGASFAVNWSRINTVAFSADGDQLLSGSDDGTIVVWNISNMSKGPPSSLAVLRHDEPILNVTFLQRGSCIAATSSSHMGIWDASSGELVTKRLISCVLGVEFSRDGAFYACGGTDVAVWETLTGYQVGGPFDSHSRRGSYVSTVAFSADGQHIFSGSTDGTIRIWDAHSNPASSPLSHSIGVYSIAFFPDGRKIVQGGQDGFIQTWDVVSGRIVCGPFKGHEKGVCEIRVSPDGRLIASSSGDKIIRLWVADTGLAYGKPLIHTNCVHLTRFSPDGQLIMASSKDGRLRMWTLNGDEVATPEDIGHKSGSVIDHTPRLREDLVMNRPKGPLDGIARVRRSTSCPAFGPPSINDDDQIYAVLNAGCDWLNSSSITGPRYGIAGANLPNGRYIISGYVDHSITVPTSLSDNITKFTISQVGFVTSLAFSPIDNQIAVGFPDGTRIWTIPRRYTPVELGNFSDTARITHDALGWVYADVRLFFWRPPSLRRHLPSHPFNKSISNHGFIHVNYHNLCIGDDWANCIHYQDQLLRLDQGPSES